MAGGGRQLERVSATPTAQNRIGCGPKPPLARAGASFHSERGTSKRLGIGDDPTTMAFLIKVDGVTVVTIDPS
jgi:hypothetical protein